MKNTAARCTTALTLLWAVGGHAQDTGFGMGLVIGQPTGISMKGWVGDTRALDAALAWSAGTGNAFQVHMDYLFHDYDVIHVNKGRMPIYYGPGGRLRVWNNYRHWHNGEWHYENSNADLAFRFAVGVAYQSQNAPVDVFLEVAPAIGIVPSTYFDMDGGIGARFWF